jgi:hypothetical protein
LSDSCDGAVRQDFSDTTCTTLDTTTELNYQSGCVSLGVISFQYTCTSDSAPYLPYQAVVTTYVSFLASKKHNFSPDIFYIRFRFRCARRYFRDGDCGTSTALNAAPADYCHGMGKNTCSGSKTLTAHTLLFSTF